MTNGKILGLDIGIASVGVGIINAKTGNVEHASSRIFPAANADNNVERRSARGGRRLIRRKKHRLKRVEDLFEKYNIDTDFSNLNLNPYQLRVKGLNEQLSNEELFAILKNIAKRRGISYLDDAEDDSVGSSDYAKAIDENRKLLKKQTPGEIQLERLEKYGQLRGNFTIQDENGEYHRLINVFSTSDYVKEARRILETQSYYNKFITESFVEDYIKILQGKRKYYVGPGNEKSRTDYGIYRTDGETLDNLFGILIGKCSVYPEEYRAAKASYTAQEYNFLNDLNNLTVPTETKKLSTEQKYQLVDFAKTASTLGAAKLLKEIAKLVGCQVEEIKGYRLDNKDKPDLHTFEPFRKLKSNLTTIAVENLSITTLDTLAHILTLNTEREGIEEAIQKELPNIFSDEQITEIIAVRKKNSQIFGKGWHSFSIKLMKELIPELYETSEEQMTILTRLKKVKTNSKITNRTKYINEEEITDEIYNPVVSKSIRQTVKIINAAIKKYGAFDQIVIEMPRESNEEDERKFIADLQKSNAKEKDDAMKQAALLYNGKDELPHDVFHGHKELATKIRLWHQQGERCLYSGKHIDIHDLIHNQNMFEIDHVLPLSLSFDDSLANKVLVYSWANQEKGQRTPFQALPQMASAWSFRELRDYISKQKGISKKKRDYLLIEQDINKVEVKQKFIERNLVDTRYASRVVLNTLQDALKVMNKETKISVIRGQFTSQLRRQWRIDKSRETYHHHAVDALIIAASSQLRLWKKQNNPMFAEYKHGQKIDLDTGEVLSDDAYKELVYQAPYQGFVNTISSKAFEDEILFSYQVDSKVNRKISDATIYATRQAQLGKDIGKDKKEETYVLGKIKDIYSQAGYDAFRKKYDKDKAVFLMYQKDPETWEKVIEVILRDYKELDDKGKEIGNPFERYKVKHGFVRKYSRKNKGTEIKSLKYYDNKLGNHIDITPNNSKHSVVLQSINPWRADLYFNPKTTKYELMGLKYADLSFEKGTGKYSISREKYDEIKEREGISSKSEFKFTLYKNDLILVKDTEAGRKLNFDKNKEIEFQQLFRFLSRTMPNQKHYVELKPYDKAKFDGGQPLLAIFGNVAKGGQCLKSLNKSNISIYKVKTDILGHKYYIKKEGDKPKLNFENKIKNK
ncbi:type II CRISPR RNA-guided endonuclease Cas9 [Streptococcus mutans]|uniref:type II CRISPR RNA-guided endonuclease Cas9 n=1 Tax=Streptococcus mutans TaxID=1309 RepID=UPI0014559755|nr:type II CRISPR RNA-guided endonuclease Cas9 [Streptococcus mutans]MDB8631573.1 type II CRISPR RNA-guided endonuclease Cas9 [Streptococcus mutans]MEE0813505.1 type II CRISPR RNA-guided endonuclease Cas9 [Streptococcus mutans]NLQ87959.1 type II CRISPR RNA-guided endonuclease Cas9 [Streptococcus mutans]